MIIRCHLQDIIVTKGTDSLIRQATKLLRQFEPEYIQGYEKLV